MKIKRRGVKKILLIGAAGAVILLAAVLVYLYWPTISADRPIRTMASINLTAAPTTTIADNTSNTILIAQLPCTKKNFGAGKTVFFSTNFGTLSATSAVADLTCRATTSITSSLVGQAIVTATYLTASDTATVDFIASQTIDDGDLPGENVLFSDDFSGTLAKWNIIWTGYGAAEIENGEFSLRPKPYTPGEDYHSVLVTAGDAAWKDYTFESRTQLLEQLETPPFPWEVGCFVLRYQNPENFYYLCHKTNGLELDRFENGIQYYLATPELPAAQIGQWYDFKMTAVGNNFKVWVDGVQYIDYTDTAPTAFLTGPIGLYSEEAHVHFDDIKVTAN